MLNFGLGFLVLIIHFDAITDALSGRLRREPAVNALWVGAEYARERSEAPGETGAAAGAAREAFRTLVAIRLRDVTFEPYADDLADRFRYDEGLDAFAGELFSSACALTERPPPRAEASARGLPLISAPARSAPNSRVRLIAICTIIAAKGAMNTARIATSGFGRFSPWPKNRPKVAIIESAPAVVPAVAVVGIGVVARTPIGRGVDHHGVEPAVADQQVVHVAVPLAAGQVGVVAD